MRFDQFTIEQLAGDLLPERHDRSEDCDRLRPRLDVERRGGTDPEEQNWVAQLDRASTVGNGSLGSTIECAQCHNHKYDPFTQKQFYQLVAFFNNAKFDPNAPRGGHGLNQGLFTAMTLDFATPEQAARRDEITDRIVPAAPQLTAEMPEKTRCRRSGPRQCLPPKTLGAADADEVLVRGGSTLTAMPEARFSSPATLPEQDTLRP